MLYLEDDSADEFDALDDGFLAPGYRHTALCGVGKQITCDLHLCTCALLIKVQSINADAMLYNNSQLGIARSNKAYTVHRWQYDRH